MRIIDWSSDVCSSDLALRSADNDGDLARQAELVVAHANLPVNLHFPAWTVGAATIDRKGAACANGDDFPLNAAMELDRRSPQNETSPGASTGHEGRECSGTGTDERQPCSGA